MSPDAPESGGGAAPDPALEALLDAYLQELADGRAPDRDAFLRSHADMADALRGVFRTLDFVEAAGRSLHAGRHEPGDRFAGFRIVRELGRGGMGIVYEAEQEAAGRRVALKVLAPGAALSPAALARFRRETGVAGELHHPNIVTVLDAGEHDGSPYYAMQLVGGPSLATLVREMHAAGTAPDLAHCRRVARWGERVADALASAHARGVVHRDVKPSNLLVDPDDHVYVSDFGLARLDAQATMTATGDVLGTPRYMSPEQARGRDVDARADIFSLGTTLYELLCLEPAFDGDTREEVLSRVVAARPVPLRRRVPACPPDLAAIVARCMASEPADRYAGAGELAEDLARFLHGDAVRVRSPSVAQRMWRAVRRRPGASVAVVVTAGLVASLATSTLGARRAEGRRDLDEAMTLILFDGAFPRADELIRAAASRGVDRAEIDLARGLLLTFSGPTREAITTLRALVDPTPTAIEPRLALAFALVRSGDFAGGREILDRVSESDIDSALGWFLHGLSMSQFQGSAAIASFDRAIARGRDFVPAIHTRAYYRGSCLLADGDREQLQPMLDDYAALVVLRPNSYSHAQRAFGWLAAACYAATQPDLAARRDDWLHLCGDDVDRALAMRGAGDATALLVQGELERILGDTAASLRAFEAAYAVERSAGRTPGAELEFFLACSRHAVGALGAALDGVERACGVHAGYYPLQLERALLLAETARTADARAVCVETVERHRRNATALCLALGVLELLRGSDRELLRGLRAGTDITSEHVDDDSGQRGLAFLAGEIDATTLLDGAGSPGARCELGLLVALRRLAEGDRDGGRAELDGCVATGVHRFGEHRFAQVLRSRLDADPAWPTWLR